MLNNLFSFNEKIVFSNFLKKNINIFKYLYINKKQSLNFSSFLTKYNYNNIYIINIIPIILIFRLINPIFFKILLQYNTILISEKDSTLQIILKKICKNLNIAYCTKWNFGNLINWNFLKKKNKIQIQNNNLFYLPELIISLNSNKNIGLLKEAFQLKIITISIVSDLNLLKIIYFPIFGNCMNLFYKKLILLLFYYLIFYSYLNRVNLVTNFLNSKKGKKKD